MRGGRLPGPVPLLVGALVLLLASVAADRGSPERGNRLHRRGESARAIALYRGRPDSARPELRYNLGTAWMEAGSPGEAEPRLAAAGRAERPDVRARSGYNLGTLLLAEGLALDDPVMAAQLVGEAVLSLREALRTDPALADARWNLGIATRALDSLSVEAPGQRTGIPTRADAAGLDRPDRPRTAATDESVESATLEGGIGPDGAEGGAAVGAGEAVADADELGARTPEQVRAVLASVEDDVSAMLQRILWFLAPRDGSGERSRRTGAW